MTEINKLHELFTEREKLEGFIRNLENLKAQGSLTQEQYLAARQEYDQRMNAANAGISQIKAVLAGQVDAVRRDLEMQKLEMNNLVIRSRVGELSPDKYQSSAQMVQLKINELELQAYTISRLIDSKSTGEIAALLQQVPAAAKSSGVTNAPTAPAVAAISGEKKGLSGKIIAAIAGGSILLIALVVTLVVVFMSGGTGGGGTKELTVPINVNGAAGLGALHVELSYDADTLQIVSVQPGVLIGTNSLFQYNLDTPGDLILGFADGGGVNGDGSIAIVIFKTTGKYKYISPLSIENVLAYNAATLQEIPGTTTEGSFDPGTRSLVPPELTLVPGN